MILNIFTAIGLMLTVFGGAFALRGRFLETQFKDIEEQRSRGTCFFVIGTSVAIVGTAITGVCGVLSAVSSKSSSEEIKLQTKKIESLNYYIANVVTGADSYCELGIFYEVNPPDPTLRMNWSVIHHGKYPVYDVEVRITDMTKRISHHKKIRVLPLNGMRALIESATKVFRVGTVAPPYNNINFQGVNFQFGFPRSVWISDLPSGDEQTYEVEIASRNGVVNQTFEGKRVNGRWKFNSTTRRHLMDQNISAP